MDRKIRSRQPGSDDVNDYIFDLIDSLADLVEQTSNPGLAKDLRALSRHRPAAETGAVSADNIPVGKPKPSDPTD